MGERGGGGKGLRVFSREYYAVCAAGGMFSAGATHLATTPLDVLKVNMQVNPGKYSSIFSGFNVLVHEQGPSSLWRGWSGKLFGYGAQGGCKFGLYEYFKKMYCDALPGRDRGVIFLASSASAQVIADVALCPFEAVKIRVQTQANFARGLADGFPKLYAHEGLSGFYKGLLPLWGRNLPFSVLMFSTFEHSVDALYRSLLKMKREDCSRAQQLGVTCIAGYASGAVGAIISNPADNIVASLYNKKANSVLQAVKSIGFPGLFTRSLPLRIALVGPVVTMQWFFYDSIKVFTGLQDRTLLVKGKPAHLVEKPNFPASHTLADFQDDWIPQCFACGFSSQRKPHVYNRPTSGGLAFDFVDDFAEINTAS